MNGGRGRGRRGREVTRGGKGGEEGIENLQGGETKDERWKEEIRGNDII